MKRAGGKFSGLLRGVLPGSLSDKRQFGDLVAVAGVGLAAWIAFEITRWIGIRVIFWFFAGGSLLVAVTLGAILARRLADPDARGRLAASWQAYRQARSDGAIDPKGDK